MLTVHADSLLSPSLILSDSYEYMSFLSVQNYLEKKTPNRKLPVKYKE